MASSSGSRTRSGTAIHPAGLRAGSLIRALLPVEVVTWTGVAPLAADWRASKTTPAPLSQVSEASGGALGTAKVAVERPPLLLHDQVPGVCGASRQSADAAGRGGGDGAGGGGAGAGNGAGGGALGATQPPSAAMAPSTIKARRFERIAFTRLLWKERRR